MTHAGSRPASLLALSRVCGTTVLSETFPSESITAPPTGDGDVLLQTPALTTAEPAVKALSGESPEDKSRSKDTGRPRKVRARGLQAHQDAQSVSAAPDLAKIRWAFNTVMYCRCEEDDIIKCDFAESSSRRASSGQAVLAVELLKQYCSQIVSSPSALTVKGSSTLSVTSAGRRCRSGTYYRWMADSGANCWLVPLKLPGGDYHPVISELLGSISCNTAGGLVSMFRAKLRTPFGIREGLASTACSILIVPEYEFSRNGYFNSSQNGVRVCWRKRKFNLDRYGGLPYLHSVLYDNGKFVPYCSTQVAPILGALLEEKDDRAACVTLADRYGLPGPSGPPRSNLALTDGNTRKGCLKPYVFDAETRASDTIPRLGGAHEDVQLSDCKQLRCRFAGHEDRCSYSEHAAPVAFIRGLRERTKVRTKFKLRRGPRRVPRVHEDVDKVVERIEKGSDEEDSSDELKIEFGDVTIDATNVHEWLDTVDLAPRRAVPKFTAAGDDKYIYDLTMEDRKAGWKKEPKERVLKGSIKYSCQWRKSTRTGDTFNGVIGFLRGEPEAVDKVHQKVLSKCEVDVCGCRHTNKKGKTGLIQHYGPARERDRLCTVPEQKPCDVVLEPTEAFLCQLKEMAGDPDFQVFTMSTVDERGEPFVEPSGGTLVSQEESTNEPSCRCCAFRAYGAVADDHKFTHSPYDPNCEDCRRANNRIVAQRTVVDKSVQDWEKAKVPGERLITDLCTTLPGDVYSRNTMSMVIDDKTDMPFVECLVGKTPGGVSQSTLQVKSLLDDFRRYLKKKDPKVWKHKSDLGSEYVAKVLLDAISASGGVLEKVPKGRHVPRVENRIGRACAAIRSMLAAAGLPAKYWSFAARTWAHNERCSNRDWRKFMRWSKRLAHRAVFGSLCYAKLPENLQATPKSGEKGALVCYLGPADAMRNSCYVMYVVMDGPDKGKYKHTTALEAQLVWPNEQQYAFKRVFEDLHLISAPGEQIAKLNGGKILAREPGVKDKNDPRKVTKEAPVTANPGPKGPATGAKRWWEEGSNCPACRKQGHAELSRNRVHTYDGTGLKRCRWSGLDREKVKVLRSEIGAIGPDKTHKELKDNLMNAAAASVSEDKLSWRQALKLFRQEIKDFVNNRRAGEVNSLLVDMLEAESKEFKENTCYAINNMDGSMLWRKFKTADDISKSVFAHDGWFDDETNVGSGPDTSSSDDESNSGNVASNPVVKTKVPMATDYEDGVKPSVLREAYLVDPQTGLNQREAKLLALHKEFSDQMLTEHDRCRVVGDKIHCLTQMELELEVHRQFDTFDDDLGRPNTPCIYVTRSMTKEERESPNGSKALRDEVLKVLAKDTFGEPVTLTDMKRYHPKATKCGMHMLSHVKHAEKVNKEDHKYKGRIVVLGNKIFRVSDGQQVYPTGKQEGWCGDVASLAAFRAVAAHATRSGHVLESADVANAYLNAEWPSDKPKHFLVLKEAEFNLLPDVWKEKINALGGFQKVGIPMDKCLYGHPLSGFVWIEQLHKWLLKNGFKPVQGTKSLYKKGNVMLCAYVDDLAVAGPTREVQDLWKRMDQARKDENGIPGHYDLREVGPCTEFLGVRVLISKHKWGNQIELSMFDYCMEIVKQYEKYFHEFLSSSAARFLDYEEVDEKEDFWTKFKKSIDKTMSRADDDTNIAYTHADRGQQTSSRLRERSCPARVAGLTPMPKAVFGVKQGAVRSRQVPISPEQADEIRDQHKWAVKAPQWKVQKMIGMLLWASRCTRTDVAFATSRLASAVSRWEEIHDKILAQLVGYLKRTAWHTLKFTPPDPELPTRLEIHTDASWHTPRSQSGVVLVWVQYAKDVKTDPEPRVLALIDWGSSKQSLTADSSAASELIAAHAGLRQCLPLAMSILEVFQSEGSIIQIRIDNEAVVQIVRTGNTKGLTWLTGKPFSIRAGCIHDYVELGVLEPKYVGTDHQLADLHTKPLSRLKLEAILRKLRLTAGRAVSSKVGETDRRLVLCEE